ncbi:MAG TPA: ABC transporter substrate-binding protein [Gaiellaceae bacterium]|nr:ABC transporter substrate-binding protein [Gaiellaceae bacterium]
MRSSVTRRLWAIALAACAVAAALTAGAGAAESATKASAQKASSAPLVVWYDAARAAYVKEYKATHPNANIKWVLYSGDNNGDGTLQSKFSLYNRVGWKPGVSPDVVFDEENYEAGWLGLPPFNDLLDLKPYISKSVWSKDQGLGDCLINGKLLCLRNDNAANVLWVNTKLWNQFFPGKTPPTTWADYAADGQSLVKNHPGYYIGEFGQPWDAETYLWGNECPINQAVGSQVLLDNPSSPNCTTIAKLIDSALGAFTHDGPFTTAWVNDKTAQHMVMDVGAIWQGTAIYPSGSGSEGPGTDVMEAYPPPVATNGAHVTGSIGGGLWMVSSHTTQPKAAAALVEYMVTSPKIQQDPSITEGLPAYAPDQDGWLKSLNGVFADPSATEAAIKAAAGEIWTGWSPVPWSVESIFGNTVTPGLVAGGTFTSALSTLAGNIKSAAQSAGWQVKSH